MNAEAKTLAEYRCPVCGHSDPNAYQRCNHPACPDGRDPRPIDRLSAPGEGVGLTRYEPFQGQFAVLMETSPEGEWVLYEDAAAALAAEKARGDGLAKALREARGWIDDVSMSHNFNCDSGFAIIDAALSVQPEETNP